MWLLPLGSGTGPGQPWLLPASARAKPADSRQASIWEVRSQSVLGPENFPRHATGTERRALTCSSLRTSPENWLAGGIWENFSENVPPTVNNTEVVVLSVTP